MRIFITGATGFVGSYVTELALKQGHTVAILKRANSDMWRIAHIQDLVEHIEGDLTDIHAIKSRIIEFKPNAIIHLAWYGVDKSRREDISQIDSNLPGSLQLAQLASNIGCEVFVGVGSQAEYGIKTTIISEDDIPKPVTMYGSVKVATYLLLKQLLKGSSTRFVWFRLFSSYGPKDNPNYLIPTVIKHLFKGECPALTPGEQMWDYIYITDVADAILRAVVDSNVDGLYNLGSGKIHSIRYIIETIRDIIVPDLPLYFGTLPYSTNQIMHLQANVDKFQQTCGWAPTTPLETGIKQTIDYYHKRMEKI